MKVSFDFDGVLNRTDVFLYALELKKRRVEIVIVTSRNAADDNSDLYAVAAKLSVCAGSMLFTSNKTKASSIPKDCVWHLDDNGAEVKAINAKHNFGTVGVMISPAFGDWKTTCEMLLSQRSQKTEEAVA